MKRVVLAALLVSCVKHPPAREADELVQFAGKSMGTRVEITVSGVSEKHAEAAVTLAFAELDRLEAMMSEWKGDSPLSKVNASAGGAAAAVPEELFAVIERSLAVARETDGAFDPTFAAMWGLWTFGDDRVTRVPDGKVVEERRKLIDWTKVELDPAKKTVRLTEKGMKLGLGGIAKGYATDRVAEILRSNGVSRFAIKAGGDLYVSGRPGAKAWRVGIQDPRGHGPFAVLDLEDAAFSTSGDYERFFWQDGVRWHHILDPDTGYPARRSRSVTVLASDAFTADGYDTAIFVMGPEKGLALAEQKGIGVVIVGSDNRVHVSSRLRETLDLLRRPTDGP